MSEKRIVDSRGAIIAVVVVALCSGAAAWALSQFMQRAYLSYATALIAKKDDSNALSTVASQLGGVAGLLGAGAAGNENVNEALATLRSRLLVAEFLQQEQRLEDVATLVGKERLEALSEADQLQAAVSYFQDFVLGVGYDARSSLITVSITWIDRQIAADWANTYLALANEVMRRREIAEARNRIAFLNTAAEKAATLELREAIYRLVESQVKSEMLAETKPDFAFRVVDPAVPSRVDEHVRPKTGLMMLAAAILGGFLAIGAIVLRGRMVGWRAQH